MKNKNVQNILQPGLNGLTFYDSMKCLVVVPFIFSYNLLNVRQAYLNDHGEVFLSSNLTHKTLLR